MAWGDRTWVLDVDAARPGLRDRSGGVGPLLGLEGVAAPGRWAAGATSGATRVGSECRHGRVEATYAPPGWGDLTIRAAWAPHEDDGLDLEVQIAARSVGSLRALEVKLLSAFRAADARGPRQVEPRDAAAAALSYDGRELDVSHLTTGPPRSEAGPGGGGPGHDVTVRPFDGRWVYVELYHAADVTRRIVGPEAEDGPPPVRYGLFGHDLERGVVVRARLRGLWLPADRAADLLPVRREAFHREPPPLS